jgi:hypothetical protein
MGFNLKRFLRRTPPAGLRQYFDARGTGLSIQADWQTPTQRQLDALFDAINATTQRDALVADFEQVEHLCDPVGQKALQSVVATDARILALLQCGESDEARSITLLLEDATLFEHALAAAYAERLRYGRSWSTNPSDETTGVRGGDLV